MDFKDLARKEDMERLTNYDNVKDYLFIRVRNAETNQDFLKDVPHLLIEDLAVTCHIKVFQNEEGLGAITVTNSLLKEFGIREEELFENALMNSQKIDPPQIADMSGIVRTVERKKLEMLGYSEEEIQESLDWMSKADEPMLVVTNRSMEYGAATIFYPDVLEELGKMLDGKFFILPSSLHEMIVLPDNGAFNYKELLNTVTEINATEVDIEDKLTDQVYHYDANEMIFERAATYEERTNKKLARQSLLAELADKKEAVKPMIGEKKTSHKGEISL